MAKVKEITVGRLFNLGNYEHVKFEVSVKIGKDDSPSKIAKDLESALNALNPNNPISNWELARAKAKLENFAENPSVENCKGIDLYSGRVRKHAEFEQQRKEAFSKLDALGVSETVTDHKENWTDDEVTF